MNNPEKLET